VGIVVYYLKFQAILHSDLCIHSVFPKNPSRTLNSIAKFRPTSTAHGMPDSRQTDGPLHSHQTQPGLIFRSRGQGSRILSGLLLRYSIASSSKTVVGSQSNRKDKRPLDRSFLHKYGSRGRVWLADGAFICPCSECTIKCPDS